MDAIDVAIIDQSSALRVQLCPLRFSTCNLHGLQTKQGITALVNSVLVQQFINSNFPLSRADIEPAHHSDIWIESGCVQFGPVYIEGNFHPPTPPLSFLRCWPDMAVSLAVSFFKHRAREKKIFVSSENIFCAIVQDFHLSLKISFEVCDHIFIPQYLTDNMQ